MFSLMKSSLIYWRETTRPSFPVLTASKGYGNAEMAKINHKWGSNIPGNVCFELHRLGDFQMEKRWQELCRVESTRKGSK